MCKQGKFISFEGVDLSGKSLQARLLHERLCANGLPAVLFREPGSTTISEKIRAILLDNKNEELVKEAELLLYSAARTQMVSEQIVPNLEKGNVVICDRFYDSSTAYQGYGRQIDLEFVVQLNTFVTHGRKPALTFLIDVEPETAFLRKEGRPTSLDRLEKEALSFHQRVRAGYLEIAESEAAAGSNRYIVIDGTATIEAIHKEVYEHVTTRLQL